MDLSSPRGSSVNDGINPHKFAMHYIKLDQIISMVAKHGPGAMMEAAYCNIAVYPEDRYLLGMKWHGQFFVDLALPFVLRSAPYIFNSVVDMVEWILLNKYNVADLMHYLDDFLTAGPPGSDQCARNLQTFTGFYSIYRLSAARLAFLFIPTNALAHLLVWWYWGLS